MIWSVNEGLRGLGRVKAPGTFARLEISSLIGHRNDGTASLAHACRQLSKGPIVTLSLQGAVYMTLSQESAGPHLRTFMQSHRGKSPPHPPLPGHHPEESTAQAPLTGSSLVAAAGDRSTAGSMGPQRSKHSGVSATSSCGMHVRVLLRPRALQLLTGRSRFEYTHGICADHVMDERRVSITFRYSPLRPVR